MLCVCAVQEKECWLIHPPRNLPSLVLAYTKTILVNSINDELGLNSNSGTGADLLGSPVIWTYHQSHSYLDERCDNGSTIWLFDTGC